LNADRIVFSTPATGQQASFADSAVSRDAVHAWQHADGVTAAAPLGVLTTKATAAKNASSAVTIFGAGTGFARLDNGQRVPVDDADVVLSTGAADALGVHTGSRIRVAGTWRTVAAVDGDAQYGHTPVIWSTLGAWRAAAAAQGGGTAPYATVIAVDTGTADAAVTDDRAGTVSQGTLQSLLAIGSFRSEIGSLLMMMALLFGISALVIGAFFTVWTMQRLGDVAVLKALGATTGSLVRDALGQAAVVLLAGVGLGIGITALLGLAVSGALPFVVSPLTTIVPGVAMVLLGLVGAAVALRGVTRADPLTALNSQAA